MRNHINLAPPVPINRNRKFLLMISLGIFGVVFVLAFITILSTLVLNIRLSGMGSESEAIKKELNRLYDKKITYLTLKERLNSIEKVINKRKDVNENLKKVVALLPDSVTIDHIEVTEDSVDMTIISNNLAVMNSIVEEKLPQLAKGEKSGISAIELRSFRQESSGYAASFYIAFSPKP